MTTNFCVENGRRAKWNGKAINYTISLTVTGKMTLVDLISLQYHAIPSTIAELRNILGLETSDHIYNQDFGILEDISLLP